MAMVLNEKYKDSNPLSFYKSRALRLFPTYYIGAILALVVSFDQIRASFLDFSVTAKLAHLFQNFLIFGQDLSYLFCVERISGECAAPMTLTINPPAWSLAAELVFYLIAPFIVRSARKVFFFIVFGCFYLLLLNGLSFPLKGIDFLQTTDASSLNYYFYPASFIFFGSGALAYHLSQGKITPHYAAAILTLIALSFTKTAMPFWHLLFISMAIPVLFHYTAKNKFDRFIGELSYPAYILHFPILLFIHPYEVSHYKYFKVIGFGSWVAILSCVVGILIHLTIEKKINSYRESGDFMKSEEQPSSDGARNRSWIAVSALFIFPIVIIVLIYISQRLARSV